MMKRRSPDSIRARIFSSNVFAVVVSSFPHTLRVTISAVLRSIISIGHNLLCSHLSSREDFSSLGFDNPISVDRSRAKVGRLDALRAKPLGTPQRNESGID